MRRRLFPRGKALRRRVSTRDYRKPQLTPSEPNRTHLRNSTLPRAAVKSPLMTCGTCTAQKGKSASEPKLTDADPDPDGGCQGQTLETKSSATRTSGPHHYASDTGSCYPKGGRRRGRCHPFGVLATGSPWQRMPTACPFFSSAPPPSATLVPAPLAHQVGAEKAVDPTATRAWEPSWRPRDRPHMRRCPTTTFPGLA